MTQRPFANSSIRSTRRCNSIPSKRIVFHSSVAITLNSLRSFSINNHCFNIFSRRSFSNSVKAQSLWVTITTSAKTSAGAPIGSATTTYYLAQEGYNKFKEGVNYTTQKTVLLSENYLEYNKGLV